MWQNAFAARVGWLAFRERELKVRQPARMRASPTRVQQKFANEQDGTKRMFFVVAGRRVKVLK
jgi:prolyl oligopeptidase PreP (S9A serine peptidase family)